MVNTNIDTEENMIRVVPLDGDKFSIEWNSEVLAEFVAAAKKVEVMRPLKDGKIVKTTITWTGKDLLENTVTATVLYKDIAHIAFNIDVVGKQAPMLGDFEFHRNLKWNDLSGDAFELVWDGSAASNYMTLTKPIETDAKISY